MKIYKMQPTTWFLIGFFAISTLLLSACSLPIMTRTEDVVTQELEFVDFGVQNGRNWVQHRGGDPGFATVMRLYPDEHLVIIITANGTNLDREKLVELIANTPGLT